MKCAMPTALLCCSAVLFLGGCEGDQGPQGPAGPPGTVETGDYVGDTTCGTAGCHADTYADYRQTGHPYKLNAAEDARQPGYYPAYPNPEPPNGLPWDQVTYVIGGWGWKARFIGTDGKIITAGGLNQWNLETSEWVDYHKDEDKPYDCGRCHTTGYNADPSKHQDGLSGIVGEWAFPGVQCEACHGPGSLHAASPYEVEMKYTMTREECGECHSRDDPYTIPASTGDAGTFIQHHEQFNEMNASKKISMDCTDCHDPHKTAHVLPGRTRPAGRLPGIKNDCETCHLDEAESYAENDVGGMYSFEGVTCVDCHMPFASKSAVARQNDVQGDVRTHIFRINTDPEAEMFHAGGTRAKGFVALKFSCYAGGCHSIDDPEEDLEWAAEHAHEIHGGTDGPTGPVAARWR